MDPYAPCPCGSGKKVKFCCQAILPEMAKIARFQENNQPRMALQLIDKLLKEHPQNAWLINQRAMALLNEERFEEARDSLVAFLRKNQDHPLANALLALAMTELEPLGNCKKVIHRAFLKSMSAEPRMVALLAGKLVDYYLETGHDMAARQHMAVVLRLESEEDRQRTLMAMLELDADTSVPYPLRGGHPLPHYQAPEAHQAQAKKAQRLYVHGCFSEAADLLDQVAADDSQSPELWHTIGLMRAWDGDEARAAAALHTAARLYSDYERAVDVETIAQLLERRQQENSVAARVRNFDVESLSRLLTRLDNEDRLCRMPLLEEAMRSGISAAYEVLDRPLPSESELSELTTDNVPKSLGQIALFDRQADGRAASAHLSGIEGENLDAVVELFQKAAGDLAQPATDDKPEGTDVVGWYSKDELALSESTFFPPKTPARVRHQLRRQLVEKTLNETWLQTPQSALNGKSPADATGDADLKVPLAAAIRVLDSFFDRRDIILDKQDLQQRLQVPQPEAISAQEDLDLNALSVPQLQRLETQGLSDEIFDRVMHRALVVKHCGLGYRLLTEFLNSRPELVASHAQEAEQAHATLADICSRSLRDEEALQWLERGLQFVKERSGSFENILMWKMRQLSFRARDIEDPSFKDLLLELWNHYGAKLPVVRQRLEEFVQALGIEAPWQTAILTPEAGAGSGGVWTAETQQTAGGEKKLWLPD